ncbi:MAG: hypothetical protein R2722_13280 [Tessaracoccus sp.]
MIVGKASFRVPHQPQHHLHDALAVLISPSAPDRQVSLIRPFSSMMRNTAELCRRWIQSWARSAPRRSRLHAADQVGDLT